MTEKRHPALMTTMDIVNATVPNNCYCQHVADAAARKVVRYLEGVMEDHTASGYYELLAKDFEALKEAVGMKP